MFDNRLDLYTIVTVNENAEYDLLTNNMKAFVPTIQPTTFRVTQDYLARLDNISNAVYGTPVFWDLIAYVNNIIDIENDMFIGQRLILPVLSDYYNFYNQNAKTASIAFSSTNGFYSL